ncbi:MAG TPA: polymer-forming cytoskeletal protein [Firmicutes bacterium]|nr:polymer-forming cytoskeletal protein [Bacillota bacterium]
MALRLLTSSAQEVSQEQAKPTTVLGPDVSLEGDINLTGDIRIDGNVRGTIHSEQTVTIGESAFIQADVVACRCYISGRFEGNLKVRETCKITSTGSVCGDIQVGSLVVEEGGKLSGRCQVVQEPEGGNKALPADAFIKGKPVENREVGVS